MKKKGLLLLDKDMTTKILWIALLLCISVKSMAQEEIYKPVDPRLIDEIDVGCIVGTDKAGEIKDVLISRNSMILEILADTSIINKKQTERLPTYSQSGTSKNTKVKIPNPIISLILESFNIQGDSIDLLELHKESLVEGNYAKTSLKKDKNAMNKIQNTIDYEFDNYDCIYLVTSLIYADSGVVQTNREKGLNLQASEFGTSTDTTSITNRDKNGLITMNLASNSPVFYSGTILYKKPSPYKALIPLGIDNMMDKQYLKGVSCLVLEGAGIGGFFYFGSEQRKYERYATSTLDDSQVKKYNSRARNYEIAKWGSIASAGLVYVIWDVICDLPSKGKSKYLTQKFQITPYSTMEGNGLSLSYNF